MAYVERAVLLCDPESEVRIVVEPGFTDDSGAECLEFLVNVKGTEAKFRLRHGDAKEFAKQIFGLAVGFPVKLTFRRAGEK